ncbi:MAG TPA: response regulator [Burkholderiales bacterium]|jgi:two-component system OmpR family response regulator|nr:response regulator [Burkholderiales bacterium]
MRDRVLIVDDDEDIRKLLEEYLRKNGFDAHAVADGPAMREALAARPASLVVLDLMLPGEDGLSLCRQLRARSQVPVLMLTAKGDPVDRIIGLEMGADDYLAKPFDPRELVARIRSILRRARALPADTEINVPESFGFSGWRLDTRERNLRAADGVVVPLSGAEYRLLLIFLQNPNAVLSRDQLSNFTFGRDADPLDRTIDMQVSRLRERLRDEAREPAIIKTVRGKGYVLAVRVESQT